MRWRRWDAALAGGVLALNVVAVLATADSDARALMPWGWALLLVSSAALLWRERFPLAVLALTSATTLAYYPLGFPDGPIIANLVIALYTVARTRGPQPAAGVAAVLAAITIGTARQPLQAAIGIVPILLLPVVLGEVARTRARQTAAAEERATLAEATRESEALRRAAEERLRIARELHDVLAHQISLINVQAGAALHTRETDLAFEALQAIRTASGDALREIRSVLGMLRDPSEADPPGQPDLPHPVQPHPVQPDRDQPDLAALPELFSRTESTGLTVRASVDLPPPVPPPVIQLAAYRIVQEALTNVVRHSSATVADVTVHRTSAGVEVSVANDGPAVGEIRSGNGLRGMAERAAAVGGEFHARPRPGGGFHIQARLPVTLDENGTR